MEIKIEVDPLSNEDYLKMIDFNSGRTIPTFTIDQFEYIFGIKNNHCDDDGCTGD